ncbi:MAG: HNH endonuclease signature motif containing protein [Eubacteriales bacterium]|nr:HNH endonuclease signature motif containing protein [Eubacteriales bacterium]
MSMKNIDKTCEKCGSTDFMNDGRCRPCRQAYMIKFRAENAGKIKEQKNKWNTLNAEKIKVQNSERCKKWRELNPEKTKLHADEWAKENPEKVKAIKKRWLEANREKHYATCSRWAKNNRPARRVQWQNYKARKLANGGTFTKQDVAQLMKQQKGKCVVCKCDILELYHIDHIMPLSLGGSNGPANIQLLCPTCNLMKWNKHPIDFMQSRGFLL